MCFRNVKVVHQREITSTVTMCDSCGDFQLLLHRVEEEYEAALQGETDGSVACLTV